MIVGYASDLSVLPGQPLLLHFASTDGVRSARARFYRWRSRDPSQSGWRQLATSPAFTAAELRRGRADRAWGWPVMRWHVPSDWPTGVYVAVATATDEDDAPVDPETRRLQQILFVVRNPGPSHAPILYKLPFFTYAAYNSCRLGADVPSTSLYDAAGVRTLHRPGLGTDPADAVFCDWEDPGSPRQTFPHWDGKMMAWLDRRGYQVDFCTDLDVHRGAVQLDRHRMLLIAGHDEYWTDPMRAAVERFVHGGGNVVALGGNLAWWRAAVHESSGDLRLERISQWPGFSEAHLFGASWHHGGGRWSGPRREGIGYTLQRTGHWIYSGVTLPDGRPVRDGDVIGADERLVGYEFDGASLAPALSGRPRVCAAKDVAPFVVLGVAKAPAWDTPFQAGIATMGVRAEKGVVFTAATTDWPRVLAGGHPTVEAITRNVLGKLALDRVDLIGPFSPSGALEPAALCGAEVGFIAANVPLDGTCRWMVDGAVVVKAGTEPTITLRLPHTLDPITVAVVVEQPGRGAVAFGTTVVQAVQKSSFLMLKVASGLRELLHAHPQWRLLADSDSGQSSAAPPPMASGGFHLELAEMTTLRARTQAVLDSLDALIDQQQPQQPPA